MRLFSVFTVLALLASANSLAAPRAKQSTITFGQEDKASSSAAKKRNFKLEIEAVAKSHLAWKKAHLNKVLYVCQQNGESTAALAKKVAEKMEKSKIEATKEAQAVEKSLSRSLASAEDPATYSLSLSEKTELRSKLNKLESAQKKGQILERLAGQVKKYYQQDAPKTSPFGGGCPVSYSTALQRGLEASSQYHQHSVALRTKLEDLAQRAKTALNRMPAVEMVAGR